MNRERKNNTILDREQDLKDIKQLALFQMTKNIIIKCDIHVLQHYLIFV